MSEKVKYNRKPLDGLYYVYHKYDDGSYYALPVRSMERAKSVMKELKKDCKINGKRIVEMEIRRGCE
jgi:hypothetical protein